MEWIADPGVWIGLATLVALEIVLGVDNLIFIAILADKLPAQSRARARLIGLSLALIMRLGLLASISVGDISYRAGIDAGVARDLMAGPDPHRRRTVPAGEGDHGNPPSVRGAARRAGRG